MSTLKRILLVCLVLLFLGFSVAGYVFWSMGNVEFWESSIRNFEKADQAHPPRLGSIVFTGSSSILFWHTLADDMKPLDVINRGFGGSQIAQVNHYVARIVINYRPKAVVLYAGENDLSWPWSKSPETVFSDFRRFVETIHSQLPGTWIYYISMKPTPLRWSNWRTMQKTNKMIEDYSRSQERVQFIDVSTAMLDAQGKPRHELFRSDGLHMDAQGYSLWTSIIRPVVHTENSVRSENAGVPTIREIMVATTMSSLFVALFALVASSFRTRAALQAEILALRHQLAVCQKNAPRRLSLHRCDRLLWVVLYRFWSGWRRCLEIVRPDTVLRWHRRAFAWHWTRKSRRLPGRPEVAANIRDLIRRMCQGNPLWGAPRIHGELLKLGIAVAQSTVARYLPRSRKPPCQTWRTFLTNHLAQTAAIDFFTVPTATFRVLFVFVVLSHERRRVLHFGVTEHPTQEWTMQQMREAFPWDQAPRFVVRDRDAIYGTDFAAMTRDMGMEEVLTAPRSPWQNPFVERLVGSIRRECLDHVMVWNERSLRRTLHNYFAYYQRSRTHLALGKDAPEPRPVEPPEQGRVVAIPQVGGLHHRYQRRAA